MSILVTNLTNSTLTIGTVIIPRHGIETVTDMTRLPDIQQLAFAGLASYALVEDESAGGGVTDPQAQNLVYAGPASGADAAPTFRALVPADMPNAVIGWSRTNYVQQDPVTYAATIVLDATASNNHRLVLTGNCLLDTPTGLQAGMILNLVVVQDGVGSRLLSYASIFKWPSGTAPTLSSLPNSVDMLSFYYDGTNLLGNAMKGFA